MKSYKLLTMSLLALAGSAIVLPLHAATTSYATGDLLLTFRDTGGYVNAAATATTENYVVDLGNVATVTGGGTHALNSAVVGNAIGNIAADLSTVFGSQWFNDPNLYWSVSAVTGTAANTKALYTTTQNPSTAWTSSNQTSPWGDIPNGNPTVYSQSQVSQGAGFVGGIGLGYAGITTSANSNFGATEVIASDGSNYTSYLPGGSNAQGSSLYYGMLTGSIEGHSATGITANSLELYSVYQGTNPGAAGVAVGSGLAVGAFSINNSGVVTFTTSAVPEPGRASLMALGLGLLALRRRRQSKAEIQA